MKKIVFALLFIAIVLISFTNCNKSDSPEPPKDYALLFKNTVWTGELRYADRSKNEPFSVVLNADGTIVWNEFDGKFAGTHKIENEKKEITLTFSSGGSFSAMIKNDSTWDNFSNKGQYSWVIHSAGLNSHAKNFSGQVLNGQTWKGNVPEVTFPFELNFLSSEFLNYNNNPTPFPYTTSAGSISFGFGTIKYFGVIKDEKNIKGVRTRTGTKDILNWEAVKQN